MAEAEKLLPPEEYQKKAEELEARLNRIEGRATKEQALHDWFVEQDIPVTVTQMEKKGLGMINRRPIPASTIIFTCPPYSCVPYETRKRFVCAYCFADTQPIEPSGESGEQAQQETPFINCPGCHEVWYCSLECLELDKPEHSAYECPALANMDIPWAKDYYQYCDDLITDIRLLIRTVNKKKLQEDAGIDEFKTEYDILISNRDCYPDDVLQSLRHVVQFTNYVLPVAAQMDEDELLEIYLKHRVNMFGLWGQNGECLGYGVYPRASYFNHSCWPNTTFFKNTTHKIPHMDFQTVFAIDTPGSEVCISYIDISGDLNTRRNTLLDKYFFHCTCERCTWQEQNPTAPDPYHKYWAGNGDEDEGIDDASSPFVFPSTTSTNGNEEGAGVPQEEGNARESSEPVA